MNKMKEEKINLKKMTNRDRAKIKEARLLIVSSLIKKAYSYRDISKEVMKRLGLATYSIATVSKDVKTLVDEWKEERLKNIDDLRTIELARIEHAEKELLEQWEESKKIQTKSTKKQTGIPTGDADGEAGIATLRIDASKTEKTCLGDPRYFAEARQQQQERRRLLGLYPSEKKEIVGDLSFASLLMESGMVDDAERDVNLNP